MHRTITQIFAAPLLIALVSLTGLISGLVGDGWLDALSWATLGVPIALYLAYYGLRKRN